MVSKNKNINIRGIEYHRHDYLMDSEYYFGDEIDLHSISKWPNPPPNPTHNNINETILIILIFAIGFLGIFVN